MSHQVTDTIIAQTTPSGAGALAVIRLTGPDAFACAAKVAKIAQGDLTTVASHTIHYGYVVDSDAQPIDQVLFLAMRAPRTFTGEDTVEICCHNNPFIIQRIIKRCCQSGARIALAGEFTQRSVVNGKIGLTQAEAINELVHAQSEQATKAALAQLQGTLSAELERIEDLLQQVLMYCQASFEFLDDDSVTFDSTIRELLETINRESERLISIHQQQKLVREGARVALLGSVNAGKSSLFNALVGKDRAIVSAIAGTTRDAIETTIYHEQAFLTLVDTAGLRQTDDIIEQEGIRRSYAEAEQADIVVLVIDSARPMTPAEIAIYQDLFARHQDKTIMVRTKSDLSSVSNDTLPTGIHISSIQRTGIAELHEAIIKKLIERVGTNNAPFLINQRHMQVLDRVKEVVTEAIKRSQIVVEYELLYADIQNCSALMSQLTGRSVNEQVMDAIFRQFCVGK